VGDDDGSNVHSLEINLNFLDPLSPEKWEDRKYVFRILPAPHIFGFFEDSGVGFESGVECPESKKILESQGECLTFI
jgi:hypothetical protein